MDRLAKLKELLLENAEDSFARYGLAMEYARQNRLEESVAEFRTLITSDPDYVAAYLQAGQTLEQLDQSSEAKAIYREGIQAAMRRRDMKARGELETALSLLD